MNHTPDFFDKTFPREIYRQMLETGNSKNLIQTLVDMQTAHGISTEQAQQTALSRVSGATASNVYELHLEWDDGRQYYEGKIYYGTMEYDFTIDAVTGAVVEWEAESIYD